MILHLPAVCALAFIPLFSLADRWVGWGGNGRTLPMCFAIVAGGLLGFLTLGLPFAFVGLMWAAWRSIGFFHNSLAPATVGDIAATALRYSLQIPIAVLAYWEHGSWLTLIVALGVSAAIGSGLRGDFGWQVNAARVYGYELTFDFNALIEKLTGAAFGAALATYALVALP